MPMDIFGPQLQGYQIPGINPLAIAEGAQTVGANALALQAKRQELQQQNALMNALQQPGVIDQETGQITGHGLRSITSISPEIGVALQQKQALAQQERTKSKVNEMQAMLERGKINEAQTDAILDGNLEKLNAYKAALPKFNGDKEAARKYIAEQVGPEIGKRIAGSGLFDAEAADRIANARTFDPDETKIAIAAATGYKRMLEQQKADEKLGTLSHPVPVGDKLVTMETVRDPDTGRLVQKPMYEAPNPAIMQAQAQAARVAGGEGALTDIAKLNADYKAGRITKEQYDAASKKKTGSKEGLTVADKMNPVMLATVRLDVTEGNRALAFMESKSLDEGSPFYANPHPGGAIQRFAQKFITPEKQQEFDVYANKLGQAIASAQSMGRGQISDRKVEEAQKAIPVMGDSKKVRELKMQQLHLFFKYVEDVLKTPIKADARTEADDQQDVNDFSHLWK